MTNVAATTCHNRRDMTLTCIRRLVASCPSDLHLDVYLTDDGSTDGTLRRTVALGIPRSSVDPR